MKLVIIFMLVIIFAFLVKDVIAKYFPFLEKKQLVVDRCNGLPVEVNNMPKNTPADLEAVANLIVGCEHLLDGPLRQYKAVFEKHHEHLNETK